MTSRVCTTVVRGLVVAVLVTVAAGCGSSSHGVSGKAGQAVRLQGWRAVDDSPGISQIAPSLSGLDVTSQSDTPALVKGGDVIRATSFVFSTPEGAAEAQKRASGDDYQGALEQAFRGDTVGRGPGVGVRLKVPRPTGAGSDTVEIYVLTRGRRLTLLELASADGFDPKLRAKVLSLFSR